MGLSGGKSNKTFVTFYQGQFCIRTDANDLDATQRENKNGKIVYEKYYTQLDGMITSIKYEVNEQYGDKISVDVMDDEGTTYTLQIPFDKFQLRDSFIKRLPNVDPDKPISIVIFREKVEGKDYYNVNLGLKQDEQWIKAKYTKDEPNGLPEPKETEVRGVKKWDFSESEDFLYKVLLEEIKRFEPAPF